MNIKMLDTSNSLAYPRPVLSPMTERCVPKSTVLRMSNLGSSFMLSKNKGSSPSPMLESRSSSVSIEESMSEKIDIQSIQVDQDIESLLHVSLENTVPFIPNVQYGKVLEVYSSTEFLIASRIYNGYTKVLRPILYKFRIHLRGIESSPNTETEMCQKLTTIVLGKIVVLYHLQFALSLSNYSLPPIQTFDNMCCLYADVFLQDNTNVNKMMMS